MTAIKQEVEKMREVRAQKRTEWEGPYGGLEAAENVVVLDFLTLDRRSKRLGIHHKLRPEEWREGSAGLQE